jgi:DHA3 family tetracycline resistance protein-like MFS transporter
MHPYKAYVLFVALWGAGMGAHATTYVPCLLERGFSLADVAAVNIFFWATISLMELPTGLLADGKSRAWSVRIGALLCAVGAFSYATAGSFVAAAICESVIGIGFAFLSGAQQAWVTDALIRRGESERVGKCFGTAAAIRSAAALLSGAGGALLGTIDLRLGWLLGGSFHVAAAVVAFTCMNGDGEPEERMTERQAFAASVSATRGTPGLGWALVMATAFGLVLPFNHYWTPFFREKVGQAWLAGVYALFHVCIAAGGLAVRRAGLFSGSDRKGVVAALAFVGIGLAATGVLPGVVLPFAAVMLHEFGRGLYEPLMDAYVQKRVGSGYRATYASFQSFIARAGFGVILFATWWLTRDLPSDVTTIGAAWFVSGGLLAGIAVAGALLRSRRAAA